MGINLGSNISEEDKDRVRGIHNPSAFDAGDFSDDSGDSDDSFGGLFDDIDMDSELGDSFGDSSMSNSFGDNSFSDNPFESSGFGSFGNNAFGSGGNSFGSGMMNPFGGAGQQNQNTQNTKKDTMDKVMDYSGEALNSIGHIVIELVKSIKDRTADDIGYFSSVMIKTGIIGVVVNIALALLAYIADLDILKLTGITRSYLLAFTLVGGIGMIGLGSAAIYIDSTDKDNSEATIESLPDLSTQVDDDSTEEYEDDVGSILDDLFEPDDTDDILGEDNNFDDTNFFNDNNDNNDDYSFNNELPNFGDDEPTPINFDSALNNVRENTISNRKNLLDTFITFLPLCTPDFSFRHPIEPDSDTFINIETAALKALSNVLKCEIEEVKSSLVEAYETYFSYEFKMKRVRGLNKTTEFASELEIYFRQSSSDTSVNATVDIEGDYYKAIITKGVTAIVTLGDALKQQYVYDFYENDKNKLPVISGIDELGNVVLDDAKNFDTMLIAGKPRSGKSWYVLGILASLMLFNTPEDVMFIIVDPKESNLFKTLALMPHVAGIHNNEKILEILSDIIDNEAPRRKKLLADNRCENIWDLRKKGIKLPVLYLVIDEYMTVKNDLKEKGLEKELDSKLQVLISQLPSQGIRLLFVPHRATGVVDKTNRTMLQFTASVKGSNDEVCDTLGIKSWKHELTNPGDVALKSSNMREPLYVRGISFGTSDEENSDLIEYIAKAYYKMGVDLPDTSALTISANRDEDYIRDTLISANRVQYNANNIFENDEI